MIFYQNYCIQLVFFCVCLCFVKAQSLDIVHDMKDVPVHQGYRIKYFFKDQNYLDLDIIPNPTMLSEWLAITIQKGVNGSNKLSLQTYNGKDLEDIENNQSYLDVGTCKTIRYFVHKETPYIVPTNCDQSTQQVDIVVADTQEFTLTKIQSIQLPAIKDTQFWVNLHTGELNMILLSRLEARPAYKSQVTYYSLNSENATFVKIGILRTSDAFSATVFDINSETYVVISNYLDISGNFTKSDVYIQDNHLGGELIKHQSLKTQGTISFTYFCFVGPTLTEHFLVAASNQILRGSPATKYIKEDLIEESTVFKWSEGYFSPLQTLLVRAPSPWIMLPGSNEVLVLLTWSYPDGIVSYQYDGFRFRRTALNQQDIINKDGPYFARLQPVSIAGEIVFTIFSYRSRAKKKPFFGLVFKDVSKTRMAYEKDMEWCRNTYGELNLAWNDYQYHYEYLNKINISENTTPQEKSNIIFDLIFGYDPRRIGYNGLEIMALQGIPPDDLVQTKKSDGLQSCEITNVHYFELSGVSRIIILETGIMGLREPQTIVFYPHAKQNKTDSFFKGLELYHLPNVDKVTKFQPLDLCNGKGIFIQGIKKGKVFNKVYKIESDYKLKFLFELSAKVYGDFQVKGFCSNHRDCLFVHPRSDSVCIMQCISALEKFSCPKGEIFFWNDHTTLHIDKNTLYKTIIQDITTTTAELRSVDSYSNIIIDKKDQQAYIALIRSGTVETCKLSADSNDLPACKTLHKENDILSSISLHFIKDELYLFTYKKNSITITHLEKGSQMTMNLQEKLDYSTLQILSLNFTNILFFSSDLKTTAIEFTNCTPR